jgi:hypothetical protein
MIFTIYRLRLYPHGSKLTPRQLSYCLSLFSGGHDPSRDQHEHVAPGVASLSTPPVRQGGIRQGPAPSHLWPNATK